MNPVTYLKDTITELKAVRWPTRQATIQLTVIVIGISLLVGLYIGAIDVMFTKLLSLIIK